MKPILKGLGWLIFFVGLIIRLNGGPEWVLAIGILILLICLIGTAREVCDMTSKAWLNSRRWMAYGEKPDWARKKK